MDLQGTLETLRSLGKEQNRKIYRRHGAGENQFGVSIANIRKLAKQIKRDQDLADSLWRTGNQDARTLATLIADPKAMTADDLDAWASTLDYYMVTDMFAGNVVANTPYIGAKADEWTGSDAEFVAEAGWNLIAILAMRDTTLPDAYFEARLERIEREVHAALNRARYAMNGALIAIGMRNARLRALAEAAANRIGKVEVDHGETDCKTPDAIPYIAKAWARKKSA